MGFLIILEELFLLLVEGLLLLLVVLLGNFPSFGKAIQGKIAFQDWSKGVALRNIKIKEIK